MRMDVEYIPYKHYRVFYNIMSNIMNAKMHYVNIIKLLLI
jgi:hypothetical protein